METEGNWKVVEFLYLYRRILLSIIVLLSVPKSRNSRIQSLFFSIMTDELDFQNGEIWQNFGNAERQENAKKIRKLSVDRFNLIEESSRSEVRVLQL